jgi:hypothetical protein
MAIEISPPVAGIGGGGMLAGGGALTMAGARQMQQATSLARFSTPAQVVPALRELQATLGATDELLVGVQSAMEGARLPGAGLFRRVPFIGGAADDLERAVRIGAAAKELAKVDETALVKAAHQLNVRSANLAAAADADVLQLGVAKAGAMSAGAKLAVGGAIAAAGALLLAASVFDVGDSRS